MRHRFFPALFIVLLGARTAGGEEPEVQLYRPAAGFTLDDNRLTDAVRVYTRDVTWADTSGRSPRLTLWYDGRTERGGTISVTLYVLPSGQEVRGPALVQVHGLRDDNLYRALALKVRAVLAGDPTIEHVAAPPSEHVPSPVSRPTLEPTPFMSSPYSAPSPTEPDDVPNLEPSGRAATLPPDDDATGPPPQAAREALPSPTGAPTAHHLHLHLEPAFDTVLSDGTALARWGGHLTLALDVHRSVEVTLGFGAHSPQESPDGASKVAIWPLYAGARFVLRRGIVEGGLGARGGAAILAIDARLGDDRVSDLRASGLLGAELVLRIRLHRNFALLAHATADVLLTRSRFTTLGVPVLDTGRVLVGFGLGAAVTIP